MERKGKNELSIVLLQRPTSTRYVYDGKVPLSYIQKEEQLTWTAAITCCMIEGCFLTSPRGVFDLSISNSAGLLLTPEVPRNS